MEEVRRVLFFKDNLVKRSDLDNHQHSRHGSLVQIEQYDLRPQIWLFHSQSSFSLLWVIMVLHIT